MGTCDGSRYEIVKYKTNSLFKDSMNQLNQYKNDQLIMPTPGSRYYTSPQA